MLERPLFLMRLVSNATDCINPLYICNRKLVLKEKVKTTEVASAVHCGHDDRYHKNGKTGKKQKAAEQEDYRADPQMKRAIHQCIGQRKRLSSRGEVELRDDEKGCRTVL